jgi:hypothetical protein
MLGNPSDSSDEYVPSEPEEQYIEQREPVSKKPRIITSRKKVVKPSLIQFPCQFDDCEYAANGRRDTLRRHYILKHGIPKTDRERLAQLLGANKVASSRVERCRFCGQDKGNRRQHEQVCKQRSKVEASVKAKVDRVQREEAAIERQPLTSSNSTVKQVLDLDDLLRKFEEFSVTQGGLKRATAYDYRNKLRGLFQFGISFSPNFCPTAMLAPVEELAKDKPIMKLPGNLAGAYIATKSAATASNTLKALLKFIDMIKNHLSHHINIIPEMRYQTAISNLNANKEICQSLFKQQKHSVQRNFLDRREARERAKDLTTQPKRVMSILRNFMQSNWIIGFFNKALIWDEDICNEERSTFFTAATLRNACVGLLLATCGGHRGSAIYGLRVKDFLEAEESQDEQGYRCMMRVHSHKTDKTYLRLFILITDKRIHRLIQVYLKWARPRLATHYSQEGPLFVNKNGQ